MKQGRADRKGPLDQKVEPQAYAKSPGGVGNIGIKTGNHIMGNGTVLADGGRTPIPLGNGYNPGGPYGQVPGWDGEGPGANRIVNKSGSQGKW